VREERALPRTYFNLLPFLFLVLDRGAIIAITPDQGSAGRMYQNKAGLL